MTDIIDEASKAVEGLNEYALQKHKSKQNSFPKVSHFNCVKCGVIIPEARRKAIKGVCFCMDCQEEMEDDIVA